MVLGEELYVIPQYENGFTGFEATIDSYLKQKHRVRVLDRSRPDPMCYLPFPSTVRVGKDLFVDFDRNHPRADLILQVCEIFSRDFRVHLTHTGDHHDGVFCPISEGQIFSTHYRDTYDLTFPDWQVFWLPDTTKRRIQTNGYNGRW